MKNLLRIISVVALGVLLSFSFSKEKKVVVIDAGHGGTDLGATREGFSEKEIVLNVAKKIKALNQNQNLEIILTREDDSYPSLEQRTGKINELKPDYTISLHVNNSPRTSTESKGMEVFVQENDVSKKLANKFSEKFQATKIRTGNLHILRESKVPTILLELGFMNNPQEREYLGSEKGQTETAEKILKFIDEN
ncbi:N-acetylmuramoyl-L-alanine amidase family protein [Epilithonimonas lactis]|uniref:N-acetylmuramoyl-L-alanine amidase family protein n=1 Tax=Epilithonimonas lactis TaxID=421072 RepID=UPI0008BB6F81|nr:N-acetylmuramoyl-L-alanine amidase [Epilithonimonas lactis]SEP69096.1 N-acetylmuramoyl-L-alanine amidase [Epilithonimonas lactis]